MSFRHVEDSKRDANRPNENHTSTWRCSHCRALVVVHEFLNPPDKCGKCQQ